MSRAASFRRPGLALRLHLQSALEVLGRAGGLRPSGRGASRFQEVGVAVNGAAPRPSHTARSEPGVQPSAGHLPGCRTAMGGRA